jgi:TRAP-type C4-dicarboxylate transport system permease small subunit
MGRLLERIYLLTALLGALCFVAVELLILYQLGGQFLPYIPRSADEFAGYCMAASAFLALAYAFNANEHIRVTLLVERMSPPRKRLAASVAVTAAVLLSAYLAWHVTKLAWQSWQLDERSAGLIAMPMWIPQSAMALGAVVFFVAVTQRALSVWRGGEMEPSTGNEEGHRADR